MRKIGAYRDVIPVTMTEVREPDLPPPAPTPDSGGRWGKPSSFQNSITNPLEDGSGEVPPPAEIRESRTEHKIEIESVPGSENIDGVEVIIDLDGYVQFISTRNPEDNLFILQKDTNLNPAAAYFRTQSLIDCDLGDEERQEIAGFTVTANGQVIERFRPVTVKRLLTLTISGNS